MEPRVVQIPSGNAAFIVIEVTVPDSTLPAHRVTVACSAIAQGTVDVVGLIEQLRSDARLRYDRWIAAQAYLASGVGLDE